jgi:hypothetical protein
MQYVLMTVLTSVQCGASKEYINVTPILIPIKHHDFLVEKDPVASPLDVQQSARTAISD